MDSMMSQLGIECSFVGILCVYVHLCHQFFAFLMLISCRVLPHPSGKVVHVCKLLIRICLTVYIVHVCIC